MWWRALGITVLCLALGGLGGYAVAQMTEDGPAAIGESAPVSASDPAVPTVAPITTVPDPSDPALGIDLPATPTTLGAKTLLPLTVDVPDGWDVQFDNTNLARSSKFKFTQPGTSLNTYLMRIDVVASDHEAVSVVLASRLTALRSAQDEGNLFDLTVEQRTPNSQVLSYIDNGNYKRVEMDRVETLGGTTAYASVAVVGREVDRPGLTDLLGRTALSMSTTPLPDGSASVTSQP